MKIAIEDVYKRQMINTDKSTWVKKMLSHIGYVAWGGCGFMGPTPGKKMCIRDSQQTYHATMIIRLNINHNSEIRNN